MAKQKHPPQEIREKQNEEYPGYPHHSPKEDILDGRNEFEQADIDLENFSRNTWTVSRDEAVQHSMLDNPTDATTDSDLSDPGAADDPLDMVLDKQADVDNEDLILLGPRDRDQDLNEDELIDNYQGLDDTDFDGEPLNEYAGTVAATGRDLDMPEVEGMDEVGMEDEENDYFSLGGDEKGELEEDQAGV